MNNILVIDDEQMILRMAGFMLKKAGYSSLTAESGAEGISLMREQMPAAVLIDNEMPGMSGLEVLEAVKSDSVLAGIPVCIMTGTLTEELKEKAVSLGAIGCISKPLKAPEVMDMLEKAKNGG